MKSNYFRYLRFALMLATLSFGVGAAKDAHAINQMRLCATFATSYRDIRSGQDYLVNATEPATRHWAIVIDVNGTTVFNDYLIGNCTSMLGISGGFTQLWVTNHVEVEAGKYVAVYPDTNEQFLWHEKTFNTPINPIGNSEYWATFNGTVPAHVSLVATRFVPSQMVIPPGSNPFLVEYKTYADMNQLSQNSGGNVYIGRIAVVGSSRVDLQACKLEYSIVSPK